MLGSLLELDQFAAYRTGPQASPGCGTRAAHAHINLTRAITEISAPSSLVAHFARDPRVRLIPTGKIYFGYAFSILYRECKIHASFGCDHLRQIQNR
jgi:hypothetical protein